MNSEKDRIRDLEEEQFQAEQKRQAKRRKQRRKRQSIMSIMTIVLILAVLSGAGVFIFAKGKSISFSSRDFWHGMKEKEKTVETEQVIEETELQSEETEVIETEDTYTEELIAEAEKLAVTYDYSGAIKLLKGAQDYENNTQLREKVRQYKEMKEACIAFEPEEVTHIFYHSLVVDPSLAFNPDEAGYDGWQQWMTTVTEFDRITKSMYDEGYVLVSIHDLVKIKKDEQGKSVVEPRTIYLPEGKKPFVLSLDDLCYYHTYDNHGVASKIILDQEGKPTCEYIEQDGTVVTGDYDVVPRMDTFLEEHPDGCYHGARGIIALTGYNGILGYRTDGTYSEENNTNTEVYYTDDLQREWLEKHPDFDWDQEREDCKKVIEAMKEDGWEFASHTWGHKAVGDAPYSDIVRDTERWLEYVGSLTGEVDTIIFAHGQDLSSTGQYDDSNEKYTYLKSKGFDIYCNVDSGAYTTTVTPDYLHQGRRNLDGYRIYQDIVSEHPRASELFDANEVIDEDRPLPVPEL